MEAQVIEAALACLMSGETSVQGYVFTDPEKGDVGVCGGEIEVFVEPVRLSASLLVIGGGHVGQAVAHLGKWLGFRVIVADDRPEFVRKEVNPDADELVLCKLSEVPSKIRIHPETYIALTTRGVDIDVEGLPAILETSAAYIGVIGSRRRWEITARALIDAGVAEESIRRVVSPIGLELNAETPEEIAVSILSQIIMLRRRGTGATMAHDPTRAKPPQGA